MVTVAGRLIIVLTMHNEFNITQPIKLTEKTIKIVQSASESFSLLFANASNHDDLMSLHALFTPNSGFFSGCLFWRHKWKKKDIAVERKG